MMASNYWRLGLEGERTLDEVLAGVGGSGGMLTHVRTDPRTTTVFFTGDEDAARAAGEALRGDPARSNAEEAARIA